MVDICIEDIVREAVKEVIKQTNINFDKVNYIVDVLDGNIALVKQHEDVKSGKITPAKKDVADIDIETDYVGGMSCKKIALKYNMTEDGIRKRLKKMGVFKAKKIQE